MGIKSTIKGVDNFFHENEKDTPKKKAMRKKAEQREKIEEKRSDRYVGYWRRCWANFDLLFFWSIILVISSLAGSSDESVFVAFVLSYILILGYMSFMQSSEKQATFGQMALDIVIVDKKENRISFGKALLRNFLWLFFNTTGFLWLVSLIMILASEKKQELTDKICGCVLLRKSLIQTEKKGLNSIKP